jgi:hypothetical protein
MYCKVENCIYNISGTCGTDTEIDEDGKCEWISPVVDNSETLEYKE